MVVVVVAVAVVVVEGVCRRFYLKWLRSNVGYGVEGERRVCYIYYFILIFNF